MLQRPSQPSQWWFRRRFWVTALCTVLIVVLGEGQWQGISWASSQGRAAIAPASTAPSSVSQYVLARQNPVNTFDPQALVQPSGVNYRPVGEWVGRLILPEAAEWAATPVPAGGAIADWVWFEVLRSPANAPVQLGQRVKLTWQAQPAVQAYVQAVTQDVRFTAAAVRSEQAGNVHPRRLDGQDGVGPLRSLAGARPDDTLLVTLPGQPVVRMPPATGSANPNRAAGQSDQAETDSDGITVAIASDPIQVPAPDYGLVNVLTAVDPPAGATLPTDCPGDHPCASEWLQVQHYRAETGQFDGAIEVIRMPQQPPHNNGMFTSTPHDLAHSPAGSAGWYIYGWRNPNLKSPIPLDASNPGVFTVRALVPRSLMQLPAQQVVAGLDATQHYLRREQWRDSEHRAGTAQSTALRPQADPGSTAPIDWHQGDRALVLHLFGGVGGDRGEWILPPGTVTGHFAYGVAEVVREPLANELQFAIRYEQVYAHNTNGIVSGPSLYADYTGNVQWGWLGLRPIADALIHLDVLTDPVVIGATPLTPLDVLVQQLRVAAARYRTGDGSGIASVTPAASCVQDSNQALYLAIETLRRALAQSTPAPALADLNAPLHIAPRSPDWATLQRLGRGLDLVLNPWGRPRLDWEQNLDRLMATANTLRGVESPSEETVPEERVAEEAVPEGSVTGESLPTQLLPKTLLPEDNFAAAPMIRGGLASWRTMIPRRAADALLATFLDVGAEIQILQTFQVGGANPTITPRAPTALFGHWQVAGIPVVAILAERLWAALTRWPTGAQWLVVALITGVYAAIAIPLGRRSGFLVRRPVANWRIGLRGGAIAFLTPACTEELLFRVLLLPHPYEFAARSVVVMWAIGGAIAFVLYHPLEAHSWYPQGNPTFKQTRFLALAGGLGITCTLAYLLTGSLWPPVAIHWLAVCLWLFYWGGQQRLAGPLPAVATAQPPRTQSAED